jgi:hypothetical protein
MMGTYVTIKVMGWVQSPNSSSKELLGFIGVQPILVAGQHKIQSKSNRCNRKSEQGTEYEKVRSSTHTLTPTLTMGCFDRLA